MFKWEILNSSRLLISLISLLRVEYCSTIWEGWLVRHLDGWIVDSTYRLEELTGKKHLPGGSTYCTWMDWWMRWIPYLDGWIVVSTYNTGLEHFLGLSTYWDGALTGREHLLGGSTYWEEAHTGIKSLLGWPFTGMKYLLRWITYWDRTLSGIKSLLGWSLYWDGTLGGMLHLLEWSTCWMKQLLE